MFLICCFLRPLVWYQAFLDSKFEIGLSEYGRSSRAVLFAARRERRGSELAAMQLATPLSFFFVFFFCVVINVVVVLLFLVIAYYSILVLQCCIITYVFCVYMNTVLFAMHAWLEDNDFSVRTTQRCLREWDPPSIPFCCLLLIGYEYVTLRGMVVQQGHSTDSYLKLVRSKKADFKCGSPRGGHAKWYVHAIVFFGYLLFL